MTLSPTEQELLQGLRNDRFTQHLLRAVTALPRMVYSASRLAGIRSPRTVAAAARPSHARGGWGMTGKLINNDLSNITKMVAEGMRQYFTLYVGESSGRWPRRS